MFPFVRFVLAAPLLAACGGKIAPGLGTHDASSGDATALETSTGASAFVGPEPCGDAGARLDAVADAPSPPLPTDCAEAGAIETLADGAFAFDVDATHVYWLATTSERAGAVLFYRQEKRCGAPVERLGSADWGGPCPSCWEPDLHLRRDDAVWFNTIDVYRLPKVGGGAFAIAGGDDHLHALVVDRDDRIFYTLDSTDSAPLGVERLDDARCAPRRVATIAKAFSTMEIVVDDTDLYVCTYRYDLRRYVLQRQAKLAAPAVSLDDAPIVATCGERFTGDADTLAWVETTWNGSTPTYHVHTRPKPDGVDAIVLTSPGEPGELALSGGDLYASFPNRIVRVPALGGASSALVYATDGEIGHVRFDDRFVYWLEMRASGTGAIRRMPK